VFRQGPPQSATLADWVRRRKSLVPKAAGAVPPPVRQPASGDGTRRKPTKLYVSGLCPRTVVWPGPLLPVRRSPPRVTGTSLCASPGPFKRLRRCHQHPANPPRRQGSAILAAPAAFVGKATSPQQRRTALEGAGAPATERLGIPLLAKLCVGKGRLLAAAAADACRCVSASSP
jgi:hypothetical protein